MLGRLLKSERGVVGEETMAVSSFLHIQRRKENNIWRRHKFPLKLLSLRISSLTKVVYTIK